MRNARQCMLHVSSNSEEFHVDFGRRLHTIEHHSIVNLVTWVNFADYNRIGRYEQYYEGMQLQCGFMHCRGLKTCIKAHRHRNRFIAKISTLKNQHGSPAPLASRRRPRGRNANLAGLNRAPICGTVGTAAA